MNDDNIDTQNGEITETPDASPAETITAGDGSQLNQDGGQNLSPEEVSWSSLKGGTQDRIKSILRERDEERAKRQRYESLLSTGQGYQTPTTTDSSAPGVQEAVRKLSEVGMATKDEVKEEINRTISGLVYNIELEKLENKFDGSNGLPKFDKQEYEDYVTRHSQYRNYTPEDVYEKMYADEIFDWKSQQQGKTTVSRQSTTSLRPTKTTVREEPLTPELIEQRLKQPDGPVWYEKNKEKINAVVASMSPES